ncbi:bacterioferritin [Williamsia sp. 1138]|uniref:ferritin n=1 Tax=Williamsia sp. 1138 TaxID=1903117 RepID=UPI000A110CE4|nr:ferritin [Williamsia sp. 1138]OZG28027.1 bacterioferritin [Williamsia sp. 1138]
MSSQSEFGQLLREQIGNELYASQQYIAIAIYYDSQKLPQLARHFYAQAVEERNHAMMIVQHFLDRDVVAPIPAIDEPVSGFDDYIAPLTLALGHEKKVTDQIVALAKSARDEGDYLGEQFMQWFLKEQVEEVAAMNTLRTVATRNGGTLFDLEDFVSREMAPVTTVDTTAPTAAGGNL